MGETREVATFGGGCFWCLEAVFQMLKGVHSVVSGYTAGHVDNPTYKQVCSGTTGHAEVVQITFDPALVSYEALVDLLLSAHDPTTLNRQGNDVGTQYRSIICTHDAAQNEIARKVLARVVASGRWPDPIVTEIAPLGTFYPAEEYHQNYFRENPSQPYCLFVVGPKVEKWRTTHPELLKPEFLES